ncbi:ATP-dependent Clp protease protease subunit, partial [Clonorchis sinensis]
MFGLSRSSTLGLLKQILKPTVLGRTAISLHTSPTCCNSLIPIVLDKTTHGERAYDIYSRLLKDRIICLMGPINDEVASVVIAQLLYLQSEDKKLPIHIYINSPGFCVTRYITFKTRWYCYCWFGNIRHNAIHPTSRGHLVRRSSQQHGFSPSNGWSPRSSICTPSRPYNGTPTIWLRSRYERTYFCPFPRLVLLGQASDIKIQAEEILKMRKVLNAIYETHTKQPSQV